MCIFIAWKVDWEAVGALATSGATIVALWLGGRDIWFRRKARISGRMNTAAALIHPIQMAKNRCKAISALFEGDVARHRARLNDLGIAMSDPTIEALRDRRDEASLFSDDVSTMYAYAVSMMEELKSVSRWLSTIHIESDEQWKVVLETLNFARECASQAHDALLKVEAAVRDHVPSNVMALRFGPNSSVNSL
jgi:hypothetical protein